MKNNACAIWEKLPFSGFDKKTQKTRKPDWYTYAWQVAEALKTQNVALVADTGAGKTVITILAIVATGMRCLFLAPTRHLCHQHQRLFERITGQTNTRVLTGLDPKQSRIWNDKEQDKVVFSTPHLALLESRNEKLDFKDFDLIVIDEFHKASGNYPYTNVVEKAGSKANILALSASPGDNISQIKQVAKNCRISKWIIAAIPTPPKHKDPVIARQDAVLQLVSGYFDNLLTNVLKQLSRIMPGLELKPEKKHLFGHLESDGWNNQAKEMENFGQRGEAFLLIAQYKKLYHAYSTVTKEGYFSFLEYAEKNLGKQQAKSAKQIIRHTSFQEIIRIARSELDFHPKVRKLLDTLTSWVNMKKTAIVFVGQKNTGQYLKEFLADHGIRSQNIFGGQAKANLTRVQKAIEQLVQGELDVLVATSVIEEGLSVPEVDMVIHYSRPGSGIRSKQRNGRTGRLASGNVVYLVLDHPLDTTAHWASQAKVKAGEKALREHTRKKQIQLTLFEEE